MSARRNGGTGTSVAHTAGALAVDGVVDDVLRVHGDVAIGYVECR